MKKKISFLQVETDLVFGTPRFQELADIGFAGLSCEEMQDVESSLGFEF